MPKTAKTITGPQALTIMRNGLDGWAISTPHALQTPKSADTVEHGNGKETHATLSNKYAVNKAIRTKKLDAPQTLLNCRIFARWANVRAIRISNVTVIVKIIPTDVADTTVLRRRRLVLTVNQTMKATYSARRLLEQKNKALDLDIVLRAVIATFKGP